MFYRIGYIEQMGTGIMRMKEAAREANVAEPQFELENFFRVTLKRTQLDTSSGSQAIASGHKQSQALPNDIHSMLDNGDVSGGNGGINGGDVGLSGGINGGNRIVVMDILRSDSAITTANISKQTGIPTRTVERIVAELKKDGIVERVGSKKAGYWRIIES
jgi:ATP-dependent DNA helicase RecG